VTQQQYIFAGLGNPGVQYEMTRHNIGFLVIKAFAVRLGWHFKENKLLNAYVVKGLIKEKGVHLVLPMTYMNQSGLALRRYLDYYKLNVKHLVVVVDDIALSFGQLRLRENGSAGGHNGLKSVETHLGTRHYARLRMGIGHPGEKVLADYVLDPFTKNELEHLGSFISRGVDILQRVMEEDFTRVIHAANTKDLTIPLKGSGEHA
jgi:PTH1 family peptidyl-tRNA hydrolase